VTLSDSETLSIDVDGSTRVPALLQRAPHAHAVLVLAHGAGAGMHHVFLRDIAGGLAQLGIATLRYEFPYMARGSRRPDPPPLCHATVRAAVATAARLAPSLALLAGGKSFGGRMTSQAQAINPLTGVSGLVFLGFPLHPPKQPSAARGAHLERIEIPMLFLQGSRDEFATPAHLAPLIETLGERAQLTLVAGADHSFHVLVRSGRTDAQVRDEMLAAIAAFSRALAKAP
jgi:predicted alpha/beta-hydrolase family hydrolase